MKIASASVRPPRRGYPTAGVPQWRKPSPMSHHNVCLALVGCRGGLLQQISNLRQADIGRGAPSSIEVPSHLGLYTSLPTP